MPREIPHFPVALYEVAFLFGALVAETILASEEGAVHIWKIGGAGTRR